MGIADGRWHIFKHLLLTDSGKGLHPRQQGSIREPNYDNNGGKR